MEAISTLPVLERISRSKFIDEDKLAEFDEILEQARRELDELAVSEESQSEDESGS